MKTAVTVFLCFGACLLFCSPAFADFGPTTVDTPSAVVNTPATDSTVVKKLKAPVQNKIPTQPNKIPQKNQIPATNAIPAPNRIPGPNKIPAPNQIPSTTTIVPKE